MQNYVSKLLFSLLNPKYSIGTHLISQKVIDSNHILTDFDSFEGIFFIAYLTRSYVFMSWESQINLNASSFDLKTKKYSIGTNLIYRKDVDSYDIQTDL